MSIDHGSPDSAGPGQARPTGDPLQMTEAEKRIAEWEARHDVAARGRRPGAETVQHYVAHERLTHPAEPRRPVEAHPPGERHGRAEPSRPVGRGTPSAEQPPASPRKPWPHRLLERLLRRGD